MAAAHPHWIKYEDGRKTWPVNGYSMDGERRTDWFAEGVLKQQIPAVYYRKCAILNGDAGAVTMTDKTETFREQFDQTLPVLNERRAKNARKRAIAIKLRALRDAKSLTQAEVAETAGMTQSIDRYVDACDGQMAMLISPTATELPNIAVRFDQFRGRVPSGERLSRDEANARGSEDKFNDGFARARGRIPSRSDSYGRSC